MSRDVSPIENCDIPMFCWFSGGYRSMVPYIIFGTEKTSPNPHVVSVLVGIVPPVFETHPIATQILFETIYSLL